MAVVKTFGNIMTTDLVQVYVQYGTGTPNGNIYDHGIISSYIGYSLDANTLIDGIGVSSVVDGYQMRDRIAVTDTQGRRVTIKLAFKTSVSPSVWYLAGSDGRSVKSAYRDGGTICVNLLLNNATQKAIQLSTVAATYDNNTRTLTTAPLLFPLMMEWTANNTTETYGYFGNYYNSTTLETIVGNVQYYPHDKIDSLTWHPTNQLNITFNSSVTQAPNIPVFIACATGVPFTEILQVGNVALKSSASLISRTTDSSLSPRIMGNDWSQVSGSLYLVSHLLFATGTRKTFNTTNKQFNVYWQPYGHSAHTELYTDTDSNILISSAGALCRTSASTVNNPPPYEYIMYNGNIYLPNEVCLFVGDGDSHSHCHIGISLTDTESRGSNYHTWVHAYTINGNMPTQPAFDGFKSFDGYQFTWQKNMPIARMKEQNSN